VGTSILTLMLVIEMIAAHWPMVRYARYFVPYLPPFFITRAARRIAERKSSHEFIRDARPYVFVAFPEAATPAELMRVRPMVMSDASAEHLGLPMSVLFDTEPMPTHSFVEPKDRDRIVTQLIESFERNRLGQVRSVPVKLRRGGVEVAYYVTSVLIRVGNVLKWQGTLMEVRPS
jgi:hypothetical protein